MTLRKRQSKQGITPEARRQVRALSARMGDHVAEMSRLNTMIDNSTSRAQRDRLRVELVEHGEAVIDLWEEYRKVRHPGAQLRSLPGGAELRATDLADLDLV